MHSVIIGCFRDMIARDGRLTLTLDRKLLIRALSTQSQAIPNCMYVWSMYVNPLNPYVQYILRTAHTNTSYVCRPFPLIPEDTRLWAHC